MHTELREKELNLKDIHAKRHNKDRDDDLGILVVGNPLKQPVADIEELRPERKHCDDNALHAGQADNVDQQLFGPVGGLRRFAVPACAQLEAAQLGNEEI